LRIIIICFLLFLFFLLLFVIPLFVVIFIFSRGNGGHDQQGDRPQRPEATKHPSLTRGQDKVPPSSAIYLVENIPLPTPGGVCQSMSFLGQKYEKGETK
jgi:hypothetical protein